MKFKFPQFVKNNNDYEDYNDEEYYGFDGADDGDDGFGISDVADETPAANPVALKIVNPKGYENAEEIADFLVNGNTVLMNLENLPKEYAIRLLDYLSGATHAVGGMMTRVGKTTIVVAPKNVDVSSIEAMVGSGN